MNRKIKLLKAFRQFIKEPNEEYYMGSILLKRVFYDGNNYDGYSLLNDIEDGIYTLQKEGEKDKKIMLLESCRDFLIKQDDFPYIPNLFLQTIYSKESYSNCDCLIASIETELGLDKDSFEEDL